MIVINDKTMCCGCTACANVCPQNCISMDADFEGFLYPVVDETKCVSCKKCEQVCPVSKPGMGEEYGLTEAYCMRAQDRKIVENSTSGGFFSPLCEYVIKNQGIVIGAACSDSKQIEHIVVSSDNSEMISRLRGSKYVQSYLGNIFSKVRELLNSGKLVCFSGTPCQVEGLLSFLGKKYGNLITVDMICHGVPSPKLWKKYVDYQEKKYHSAIKSISFRKKTYGYHSGTMELIFENGKKYRGSARIDYMLKSFFSEISSRPSCYKCNFKSENHKSDFTIFDCWSAAELVHGLKDDDKGYTNVFVNTKQGKVLLKKLKSEYKCYKIDLEEAVRLDGSMVRNSAVPHPRRREYYKDIENEELSVHIQKFIPVFYKDYFIEAVKGYMYKLKILNILKKLVK